MAWMGGCLGQFIHDFVAWDPLMAWNPLNPYLAPCFSERVKVLDDIQGVLLAGSIVRVPQVLDSALVISKYNHFPAQRTVSYREP